MYVLNAGSRVFWVRFFPDGRRLLVGISSDPARFEIWTLPDGDRVRLPLPALPVGSSYFSNENATALHPTREVCYLAWGGRLVSCDTDSAVTLPIPKDVTVFQVVVSPTGDRLLAATFSRARKELFALEVGPSGATVVWRKEVPLAFHQLAGFLPDGYRFVTVSDKVTINTFGTGGEQEASRYPAYGASDACLSPDGRHLGVIGYGSLYIYDTAALGKPRRITSNRSSGQFVSFAFHPDGRTLAVIHGGPTLVKIYDVATLKRTHTFKWIGDLTCVTFSPDGMLGAAGSRDGRVVVWDVDT